MSNINRAIAKEMYKLGTKVVVGNSFGSVSADIEWIKWLSYEPDFEKERTQYLNSKKVSELSYEELEEATKYKKNKVFAKLFRIYRTETCSEEDYMKVYDFMCNESIEDLMLSKLTQEELEYAKEEITRLSNIPKKELSLKIKQEKESYNELSIVDSYILHMISIIGYSISLNDLNNKIDAQINENAAMRQKSLYYASK